ncbi:unnamed protein product [Brachionus calyciflorus]|uniref:Uncharacterized protein n=1 Tax=Brachionus calyciflorus TaxID=104777 RepID=A0A813MTV0_9BILA|nr:unnamed protein product [Brachionus calyciflorus]
MIEHFETQTDTFRTETNTVRTLSKTVLENVRTSVETCSNTCWKMFEQVLKHVRTRVGKCSNSSLTYFSFELSGPTHKTGYYTMELLSYSSNGNYVNDILDLLNEVDFNENLDIVQKCKAYNYFLDEEHKTNRKNNIVYDNLRKIFTENNGNSHHIYNLLRFDNQIYKLKTYDDYKKLMIRWPQDSFETGVFVKSKPIELKIFIHGVKKNLKINHNSSIVKELTENYDLSISGQHFCFSSKCVKYTQKLFQINKFVLKILLGENLIKNERDIAQDSNGQTPKSQDSLNEIENIINDRLNLFNSRILELEDQTSIQNENLNEIKEFKSSLKLTQETLSHLSNNIEKTKNEILDLFETSKHLHSNYEWIMDKFG